MGGGGVALSLDPRFAAPVRDLDSVVDLVFHSLPEDAAVTGGSDVSEDRVLEDGLHGNGVAGVGGARSYPEESVLGVDGSELAVVVEAHPGDVVADALDLVAGQAGGHHSQVSLAASRGESCRDVAFFTSGVGHTKNLRFEKRKNKIKW